MQIRYDLTLYKGMVLNLPLVMTLSVTLHYFTVPYGVRIAEEVTDGVALKSLTTGVDNS